MVPIEDLSCKSGCLFCLTSFYWKIPDCIGFDVFTSLLCLESNCRTGLPKTCSLLTLMGQCFCIDIRCAFPCDSSRVPMTIGLCGFLCPDCKKGDKAASRSHEETAAHSTKTPLQVGEKTGGEAGI